MAAKRILTKIDPTKLVKHPLSLKIYGEKADAGFDAAIKARGIDEPIVVAADQKTIVSGVRRRNAAIKAKITEVPILVRQDLTDKLDIEEAIIEANRHNEQTVEAKTKAFQRLKEIESERTAISSKKNLKQGKNPTIPPSGERLPHSENSRAAEKAAEQVGLSRKTLEKAAVVVDKITEADKAGDVETATELRETLEHSVSEAHRQVTGKQKPARTKAEEITIQRSKLKKTAEALQRAIDDLHRLQKNMMMRDKLLRLANTIIEELPNWK